MENSQRANKLFAGFSKCVSWNDADGQKDMLFNSPDIGGIFNDLLYHKNRHVFGTLEITPEWTKPKLSLLLFTTLGCIETEVQPSIGNVVNSVTSSQSFTILGAFDQGLWSSGRCCPGCDLLGAVPKPTGVSRTFGPLQSSSFHGNLRASPPMPPPSRK